jgi:CBS-domain-containing membrane protein
MDPPYDFDSEGPGKAGPYQRSNYNEDDIEEEYSEQDETYDIDEDLKESFLIQKNKINEMMNRMKIFK